MIIIVIMIIMVIMNKINIIFIIAFYSVNVSKTVLFAIFVLNIITTQQKIMRYF